MAARRSVTLDQTAASEGTYVPSVTGIEKNPPFSQTKLTADPPRHQPLFRIGQRVYGKADYDAESALQQQSYWIKSWRWDQVYGQMRYMVTYTPNGQVYGSEAEDCLVVA